MKRYLGLSVLLLAFVGLPACNVQQRLVHKKQGYMEKVYAEIKDSIGEADVSLLNDTIKVLFPEDLLFPSGKSELLPSTMPLLKRFASALNEYRHTSILINGYTDNTGTESLNSQLSMNRAKNTGDVLQANDVSPSRIFYWGRGSGNPVANNHTKNGRRLNRRVEFIILYNYVK